MSTSQMNGLAYLTAIKNGEIASSPMSEIIPMRLTVVRENYVEYEVRPDHRHFNLQGGIHGGFVPPCWTVLRVLLYTPLSMPGSVFQRLI